MGVWRSIGRRSVGTGGFLLGLPCPACSGGGGLLGLGLRLGLLDWFLSFWWKGRNVRWTFEGRFPAFFARGDAVGLVFPAVDLRAGESVVVVLPAGRPRARCGVPEGPARIADLVAIVVGEWCARSARAYSGGASDARGD